MLNKKEIIAVLIATIIFGFVISLMETLKIFFYALITIFFVIIINLSAKKVTSFYFDSEIEVKLWEIERYGFKAHKRFKRPFPAGAFFPIISKIFLFPFGGFVWLASLVFEIKPKIYKAAKRHGLYTFSEMAEDQIGLIAASGILANLLFALIGYLIGIQEFAKLNIYYAFFNMIPLSDLDGNKIFFGSPVLWSFLASIILIILAGIIIIF